MRSLIRITWVVILACTLALLVGCCGDENQATPGSGGGGDALAREMAAIQKDAGKKRIAMEKEMESLKKQIKEAEGEEKGKLEEKLEDLKKDYASLVKDLEKEADSIEKDAKKKLGDVKINFGD